MPSAPPPETQRPDERRKHPRVPVALDARWQTSAHASLCEIDNLSLGGCFVRTPIPPAADERAFITLYLKGRASMLLAGRVARVEPGVGFGMQFREMLPETKSELSQEIDKILGTTSH